MNDYVGRPPATHATEPFSAAPYPRYDDEISLYDLWDVLARRRMVILVMLVLTTAAGAAYAWMTPHVYEYRSGIEVGHIYRGEAVTGNRHRLIESPEATAARLHDVIIPAIRHEQSTPERRAPRVSVQVRSANDSLLLTSTARADQREAVEHLHAAIADALVQHQQPRYDREFNLVLRQVQVQAEALAEELAVEQVLAETLETRDQSLTSDSGIVALADAQRLADLRRSLSEKRSHLARIQTTMDGINEASIITHLSFLASRSEEPVGVGRSVILVLSIVLGAMSGVFMAFFWEFVSNARQRR